MNIERRRAIFSLFALPFVAAASTPAVDQSRPTTDEMVTWRREADRLAASAATLRTELDALAVLSSSGRELTQAEYFRAQDLVNARASAVLG